MSLKQSVYLSSKVGKTLSLFSPCLDSLTLDSQLELHRSAPIDSGCDSDQDSLSSVCLLVTRQLRVSLHHHVVLMEIHTFLVDEKLKLLLP